MKKPTKKKILIGLCIFLSTVIIFVGYIAWATRNTAQTEANNILSAFTRDTNSNWYCENGYGKGIDNDTQWWEQIYLSSSPPEDTASKIEAYLQNRDYDVSKTLIENSQDNYNEGKTYWEINGSKDGFSVITRISSQELTLNNCFEGASKMNSSLNPENYDSVIVIMFTDNN